MKISEVISAEIDEITEEDCIAYIQEVVIHRTYDGYTTEIKTVYGQLERELGCKISPAPDEWDRIFQYLRQNRIHRLSWVIWPNFRL